MPIVLKPRYEPDEVPTAADLNAPYDDLEIASTAISDVNTASGWMTLKHIDKSSNQANSIFHYQNSTTVSTSYNSTTFTTISQGGNPARVTLNFQPKQFETLRLQMSGLVSEVEVTDDYDYAGGGVPYTTGPNKGKPNYYAFRILLTYNDGGPSTTTVCGQWGYSFTTSAYEKYFVDFLGEGTSIQWQTFQGSTLIQYNGATGTRTYEKAELQVAVFNAANTVKIARHQLQAIRAKG
jgi:hypothetical protein